MSLDDIERSGDLGTPEQLFLFTMGDTRWGYVNAPIAASYNNIPYAPLAIEMDDLTQALSEDSPTIQIRLDAASSLARQFIPYMPNTPIRVRVYRHHVEDPEGQFRTELIGEVANASISEENDECVLSVRLVASAMDRKVPWPIYQKQCNHVLYGPGCRVNRDNFKVETTVQGVAANRIWSPDFLVPDDPNYFRAGYVVRVDTNETRWVVAQEDNVLVLQVPFVDLPEGTPVVAFAGCDLLKSTCENKFNNLPRFLGFQWIPNKNPFSDNIFGTGTTGVRGDAKKTLKDYATTGFTR